MGIMSSWNAITTRVIVRLIASAHNKTAEPRVPDIIRAAAVGLVFLEPGSERVFVAGKQCGGGEPTYNISTLRTMLWRLKV